MSEEAREGFIQEMRRIAEEKKKYDLYNNLYNSVPPEARSYLSYLSSQLLESDVYKLYKENPFKKMDIVANLTKHGLNKQQVGSVMGYFHLDDGPKNAMADANPLPGKDEK